MLVPFDEPTNELNAILDLIGRAQQDIRYVVIQVLHHHIPPRVHRSLSSSRSGMRWSEVVAQFLDQTIQLISESCVRAPISKLWKEARQKTRHKVADIVSVIMPEDQAWSSLLFDHTLFALSAFAYARLNRHM